jgi:hypothetical protein
MEGARRIENDLSIPQQFSYICNEPFELTFASRQHALDPLNTAIDLSQGTFAVPNLTPVKLIDGLGGAKRCEHCINDVRSFEAILNTYLR